MASVLLAGTWLTVLGFYSWTLMGVLILDEIQTLMCFQRCYQLLAENCRRAFSCLLFIFAFKT